MDRIDSPSLPKHCAGIITINCTLCEFEFVYLEPEETVTAIVSINNHLRSEHHVSISEVKVLCTRH